MAHPAVRPEELEAYLDEALPPERMKAVEEAIRADPALLEQLSAIIARRDRGVFSLGEVWRRNRLSCPSREVLGAHLLGALPPEEARYVQIHLEQLGCRYCLANWEDLKRGLQEGSEQTEGMKIRHERYFRSSVRHLPRRQDP